MTDIGTRAYDEPSLYFRSDDDERTLLSGQILLETLFGQLMKKHEDHYVSEGLDDDRPVIPVHTADRDKDVLAPNPNNCPRLNEIEMEAIGSPAYQDQYVQSEEAQIMANLSLYEFGGIDRMRDPGEAIDCVMTTKCEDKTLPYVLDDAKSGNDPDVKDKYGNNLFQRLFDFVSELY